ncbi:hypothetical protein [Chitinophaga pinensis]|uniref:hypothetical protein n=1 Tax=Chitinophaga pinensis TaxID=79329 RepID=UPI0021BD8762|nr:hypothetical protein [Chitinophaga pinensis]
MNLNGEDIVVSQNNLPGGLILGNSTNRFDNRNTRQSANGKYIFKVDTTATITAYADGAVTDNKTASYGNAQNLRGDSSMIYNNESSDHNDYHLRSYNVNLAWEKRLKKPGRTVSLYLNNNFSNDHSSGEICHAVTIMIQPADKTVLPFCIWADERMTTGVPIR